MTALANRRDPPAAASGAGAAGAISLAAGDAADDSWVAAAGDSMPSWDSTGIDDLPGALLLALEGQVLSGPAALSSASKACAPISSYTDVVQGQHSEGCQSLDSVKVSGM